MITNNIYFPTAEYLAPWGEDECGVVVYAGKVWRTVEPPMRCMSSTIIVVWPPKYRKHIGTPQVKEFLEDLFPRVAKAYGFEVLEQNVQGDHIHLFVSAPPRFSPAELVEILKSLSAREVFQKFPRIRKELWGGELWASGYFVRGVGDKVTSAVIQQYVRYLTKRESPKDPEALLTCTIPHRLRCGRFIFRSRNMLEYVVIHTLIIVSFQKMARQINLFYAFIISYLVIIADSSNCPVVRYLWLGWALVHEPVLDARAFSSQKGGTQTTGTGTLSGIPRANIRLSTEAASVSSVT